MIPLYRCSLYAVKCSIKMCQPEELMPYMTVPETDISDSDHVNST